MSSAAEIQVHLGDCLPLLRGMDGGSVALAYLDPPFFTQKVHRLGPRDRSREFSFDDLWSSQRDYGRFLLERLHAVYRVLSERGSIFFHSDRRAVHLVRLLLDEVFGAEHFRAEIIWHYRRWSHAGRGLLPAHQTILYYTKSEEYVFNGLWTEYSPATNVEQTLQRRVRDGSNKSVYERDADGNVIPNGAKRGVPLGDVWDIPFLNPKAKERTGYPTQKPLMLLERIIGLASNEGDCVLDPFCGSGTTLVAAQALGRRAVGIDVSEDAARLTQQRLGAPARGGSRLVQVGRDAYRRADDAALAMLQGLDYTPVQRNSGMDALLRIEFEDRPVPVRVQRPGETLLDAAWKLARASAGKGAKVMFVVAIAQGGAPECADELPPGVIAVDAPALGILDQLERIKARDQCSGWRPPPAGGRCRVGSTRHGPCTSSMGVRERRSTMAEKSTASTPDPEHPTPLGSGNGANANRPSDDSEATWNLMPGGATTRPELSPAEAVTDEEMERSGATD
jgi:site-specific DNA-methyltransferase (adenine-specific)